MDKFYIVYKERLLNSFFFIHKLQLDNFYVQYHISFKCTACKSPIQPLHCTYHHSEGVIGVLLSEHKLGSCVGKAKEGLNLVPQELKHRLTDIPLQNQGRKEELESQTPDDRSPTDLFNNVNNTVY